jgi:hypothetical protein
MVVTICGGFLYTKKTMLRCGCMESEHVLCQRRCAKVDLHNQDAHATTRESFVRLKELAAVGGVTCPPFETNTLDPLNPHRTVLVAASKNPLRTSQLLLEMSTGCECGAQLENAVATMHLQPRPKMASCTMCTIMLQPPMHRTSTGCSPECPSVPTASSDPVGTTEALQDQLPQSEILPATATPIVSRQ